MKVIELAEALLEHFPSSNAEGWDKVGLSVGDPHAEVTGVACALDVTPQSIDLASEAGASVLLTHHPVCLEMPARLMPGATPGGSVWQAIRKDVALIAMHTNLDRDAQAVLELPRALGYEQAEPGLERACAAGGGRLGAQVRFEEATSTQEVAQRVRQRLGRVSQVFDAEQPVSISRLGFYGGSMGSEGCADALAAHVDAVVCGECGYHRALDLVSAGCAVIIIGHDVSELPMVALLARAAVACGVPASKVQVLNEPQRWS